MVMTGLLPTLESSRQGVLGRRKRLIPGLRWMKTTPALVQLKGQFLIIQNDVAGKSRERGRKTEVIHLDGAAVQNLGEKGVEVSYFGSPKARKSKRVVLECADGRDRDAWTQALRRVACEASSHVLRADALEEHCILGRGFFGRVVLATHLPTGALLAVKEMREESEDGGQKMNKVYLAKQITERAILEKLAECPFVARLALAFRERGQLYLGIEVAERGDLLSLIKKKKKITLESTRFLLADTVAAIGSVHAHGIVHRDIKLENLALDASGHIKLLDFGLAKELKPVSNDLLARCGSTFTGKHTVYGYTFTHVGTCYYFSPEMIHGSGHSLPNDWWQVGCLFYELLTGRPAFFSKDAAEVERRITSRQGPALELFTKATDGDANALGLLDGLLTHDAADRLGALGVDKVMQHPFFSTVNWALVEERASSPPQEILDYVASPRRKTMDTEVVSQFFWASRTMHGESLTAMGQEEFHGTKSVSVSSSGASAACSECTESSLENPVPRLPFRSEATGPLTGFEYVNLPLLKGIAVETWKKEQELHIV